jgi:hypothetical protein
MNKVKIIFVIFCCAILISSEKVSEEKILSRQKRKLVFLQFTVLQLTVALVSQISYIPSHRVAVNTGFGISYGLPFSPKNFYHPAFWGRSSSNDSSTLNKFFNRLIENNNDVEEDEEEIQSTTEVSNESREFGKMAKRDLSAGEFYHGIKETLSIAGYHEECLLKCVCELAKHPLVEDEDNLMTELLHFVLTPSVHKGFDGDDESDMQKAFEDAERFGKIGGDCDLMYDNCEKSPLHKISNFVTVEE